MKKNNLNKQGKKLNRNELKEVTGGIRHNPNCPPSCMDQDPGGFRCPDTMDCIEYSCGENEYGYYCA
ncbi:hypothetical protein [Pedobacter caeni]|uniref:Bacteriocin-type signal sequence-containing protein n=1 Tax=Pedobacter caeni TaxID=288992 RepID=A0A1M4ZSQ2_9SPHI|nr:hypothetical protein [Pedobacter caeni]SHF21103.1 hypothetical protein SAMN04488522_102447 [Pedobacter caeni]